MEVLHLRCSSSRHSLLERAHEHDRHWCKSSQLFKFNCVLCQHGLRFKFQSINFTEFAYLQDCDLYLRYNTAPTSDDYDRRDVSFAPNVTLNVDNARGGTWWAGVFGFTECHYQFQAVVTGACPQNCNGNGDCLNGACRCYNGYFGDACEHGKSWCTQFCAEFVVVTSDRCVQARKTWNSAKRSKALLPLATGDTTNSTWPRSTTS